MDAIRQWAFSLCSAMVACGLAQMLLPKSNMEKVFRVSVSVFFLCCLLSPLVLQNPELRIEIVDYSQADIEARAQKLAGVVEDQSDEAIRQSLEKIVEQKLQEKGIKDTGITIHITTNGQHDSEEPVVEILLGRAYEAEHERIHTELETELGVEVRLGYR